MDALEQLRLARRTIPTVNVPSVPIYASVWDMIVGELRVHLLNPAASNASTAAITAAVQKMAQAQTELDAAKAAAVDATLS